MRTLSKFIYLLSAASFTIWGCSDGKSKPVSKKETPNILIILADDMGYGDPSSFNPESKISTPNIDRLAGEGIKFTNAHAAGPWCVPSRYGLLTGRFPFRNEREYSNSMISSERLTIGKFLQQSDYQTACIGKWHQGIIDEKNPVKGVRLNGGPVDKGFDYYFGIPASLDIPPYYYIENDHYVDYPSDSIGDSSTKGWSPIQGEFWRKGMISPGFQHKNVLSFLSGKVNDYLDDYDQSKKEKPFFMYFAMTAPHTPWLPEKMFKGKSGAGMYGDFVMQSDYYIGTVLQKLDDLGLSENTLVLFASDNGPVWFPDNVSKYGHNSVGSLSGMKSDVLEGGHRMPFIVRWPGHIEKQSESDAIVSFTDIIATVADILEKPLPKDSAEDSFSFLPLLKGKKDNLRPPVIITNNGIFSITYKHWKYINGKGPGGFTNMIMEKFPNILPRDEYDGQLYNLSEDIGERHNLYAENPEKVKELSDLLDVYIKKPTRPIK
ncbi:MAG TPA: arylsulfatase [Leeuwenhoekiella sp.]|nr:arylsulfatase [Leeuwenhoekiella sp.]